MNINKNNRINIRLFLYKLINNIVIYYFIRGILMKFKLHNIRVFVVALIFNLLGVIFQIGYLEMLSYYMIL